MYTYVNMYVSYLYIVSIYINISINSHNHVTSTIWSEYVSEQIRAAAPCCLIGITRVGSSEADPTKK